MKDVTEEVVWPSRLAALQKILLQCPPRDVRSGNLLPDGYHLTFGSEIYPGQFSYPFDVEITRLSSFRIGEPISTSVDSISQEGWSVTHGGLRGPRWTMHIRKSSALTSLADGQALIKATEVDLRSVNFVVAAVMFGSTGPHYFGRQDRLSLAQLSEYWLLASILASSIREVVSVLVRFECPFDRRNEILIQRNFEDGAIEIVGNVNGRLSFFFGG